MSLPTSELFPDDPDHLPPARRRRAKRLLAPLDIDERAVMLDALGHDLSSSFDFFLFSLLGGMLLGVGLLLDAPAILLLGALLAPFMAPLIGLALGMVTGSASFFIRSLAGMAVGAALALLSGVLAGLAARFIDPAHSHLALTQAYLHTRLSWLDFLVAVTGAVFAAATVLHNKRAAAVASVALAYELYLPLAAAGLGLVGGYPHLWPDGLVVFSLHLAGAALLGALTFAVLGYRPLTLLGYTLGGTVALLGIILVIGIGSAGAAFGGRLGLPTLIPTATPTLTLTPTATFTPVPPSLTPSLTPTITVTPTRTQTPVPTATPHYAMIAAADSNGALLRAEPGGAVIRSYVNGALMQLMPETQELNGVVWVKVIGPDNQQGWMMQGLIITVTPIPETPAG